MIQVSKKHKKNCNKSLEWLKKYNATNDLRDIADNEGDDKSYKKYDRKCQEQFDKFLEYMEELPKYLQKQIYKSELY